MSKHFTSRIASANVDGFELEPIETYYSFRLERIVACAARNIS